jgi:hypothetical protein
MQMQQNILPKDYCKYKVKKKKKQNLYPSAAKAMTFSFVVVPF